MLWAALPALLCTSCLHQYSVKMHVSRTANRCTVSQGARACKVPALQHHVRPAHHIQHVCNTSSLPARRLKALSQDDTGMAATEPATQPAAQVEPEPEPEVTFFSGSGSSNAELAISLLLGLSLIYAPLSIASLGRKLWINYKFTNKRVIVTNTSPLFKNEVQISYDRIKEVLTVPRAFGAWGDMVIVLKDGARLEILGFEKYAEVKEHIEKCKWTLKA